MTARLSFVRSLVVVFAVPIFTHAHLFLGLLLADPIYRFASLGSNIPGPLPGSSTIDPNFGFIDQALTHRAMLALLSGSVPWWNPYEGFGSPLAGEMQCSAFFPFSLLVLLPNGLLFEGVLLQIIAGIGVLLLCRRLGLSQWAALVAAVTYQSCGTFAWLSGAWSYSIPWLPFVVLGIELARDRSKRIARVGMFSIAGSLALLLCAGFIETSYFEGLLGVLWFLARIGSVPSPERIGYLTRVFGAALIGFALGAPIVIAFADTLSIGFVGMHDGGAAGAALVPWARLQKLMPYIFGPIFASKQNDMVPVWGATGGFLGFGLATLALSGVFGRRLLSLRIVSACFVLFGYAAMFGGPLQAIVLAIPGVKYTAYFRYLDPAIGFACSILAAMAIDDLIRERSSRAKIVGAVLIVLAATTVLYVQSIQQISGPGAAIDADLAVWHTFSLIAVAIVAAGMLASVFPRDVRTRAAILGFTICVEAVTFVFIPTLSNPSSATLAIGDVAYLKAHLGLQRFFSFGPINPNYGSLFGIADIDYNDLPVPKKAVDHISSVLDPGATPGLFLPMGRPGPSREEVFQKNIAAYEASGVAYIVTAAGAAPPATSLVQVYRDAVASIWKMPASAPYFSAPGCAIAVASRESLTATCRKPATLCRLELDVPGWAAVVNGSSTTITSCEDAFQSIALPTGVSTISFGYVPPRESPAIVVWWLGVASFLLLAVACMRAPRSTSAVV